MTPSSSSSNLLRLRLSRSLLVFAATLGIVQAFNPFIGSPRQRSDKPELILITGPPGTGKSTFGMSIALDQGILKCISTDTVRAVMRSFVDAEVSPALHRSSYAPAFEDDDPVRSWKETCQVLSKSVESLVDDAISRKVSLVVEGVHVVPSAKLIEKWEKSGGVALGCVLQITDPGTHKRLLMRRGYITGNVGAEAKKITAYDRVRAIQDEMIRLGKDANWLLIEQKTEPDPLEMVSTTLYTSAETTASNSISLNGAPSSKSQKEVVPKADATSGHTSKELVSGADEKK